MLRRGGMYGIRPLTSLLGFRHLEALIDDADYCDALHGRCRGFRTRLHVSHDILRKLGDLVRRRGCTVKSAVASFSFQTLEPHIRTVEPASTSWVPLRLTRNEAQVPQCIAKPKCARRRAGD